MAPTSAPGGGGAATGTAAATAGAMQPISGGTLRSLYDWDADTFDVLSATSGGAMWAANLGYGRLMKYEVGLDGAPASGNLMPDMAESMEQPDDVTYLFTLRGNAPWDEREPTSGRPLDAEDVVVSYDRWKEQSPKRASMNNAVNPGAPILNMEALDDRTVQINLAHPDALFLGAFCHTVTWYYILPKEASNGGFDPVQEQRGNGPYILDEYQSSVAFKFRRNPNWYGGPDRPYFEFLNFPVITDAAQAEAQLRSGNLHYQTQALPLDQNIPELVQDVDGLEAYVQLPPQASNSWSWGKRPDSDFNDVRVRRAVSMAIDRDTFIKVIDSPDRFDAIGTPLGQYWSSPLSPGYGPWWLDPKGPDFGESAKYLQHNVDEAVTLLDAAGFNKSNPLKFEVVYPGTRYGADWPTRVELTQAMLAEAGIQTEQWVADPTTEWTGGESPLWGYNKGIYFTGGDFQGRNGPNAVTYTTGTGKADAVTWLSEKYGPLKTGEIGGEDGEWWPELGLPDRIADMRNTPDFEERMAKAHDFQRYIIEHMVTLPMGQQTDDPGVKWAGLHGPGTVNVWGAAGAESEANAEAITHWWADESLQA